MADDLFHPDNAHTANTLPSGVQPVALIHPREGYTKPVELLSWEAPNRIYDPKSASWFLGVFVIALVLVILFALMREILLILLVAAGLFVLYALKRTEPPIIEHRLLNVGVEIGGRLYPWKDLHSFWLSAPSGIATLRLDTKLHFPHMLELFTPEDLSQEDLEKILLKYLPLQQKPHSEMSGFADTAILTVANALPFRDRILGWWEKRLG